MEGGLNDFLKVKADSTLNDEFSKKQTFVEVDSEEQEPEDFEEENTFENHQPPQEKRVYDDWLEPKLSKDELHAKAKLEAFKYGAIISGSLTMTYSLLGLMPQPLTPGEVMIYDDYLMTKRDAKRKGHTLHLDQDDEIHDILKRKRDLDTYTTEVKLDKEQMQMLEKSIFVTMHGKNERGELGQMSITGAVAAIALAKAAPRLGDLIPVITGYIKKGIDKMRNAD